MVALPDEAYRFALDNTIDAVVITDLDSVIRYANPAFAVVTGFSAAEAVGRKPSMLRSRHTTAETYRQMWSTILSGGWWRGEIINVRKSGEEWYSYLTISQIKDAEGRPVAYVGISRDITEMKQLQFRLKEANLEAIFMLSVAAEAKDEVTGNHVQRVRLYSEALARKLGFSDADAEEIGYSSMLHDIGKMHVPDAVLKKAGILTREEWDIMRLHPEQGVQILRDKPFYAVARDIAGNHHERWDGRGYPAGKKGDEIPLASRITALADVFDALTTARPYKDAWPEARAVEEIRAERGKLFDPAVVDAFLELIESGVIHKIYAQYSGLTRPTGPTDSPA